MRIATEAIEVLQKAQAISRIAGIMDGIVCKYLLLSLVEHKSVSALLDQARVSAIDIRKKVAVAHRDPTEVPYPSSHHKLKAELASMRANAELSADEYCKDAAKLVFDRRTEEANSPVWKALNYAHNEARARGDSIGVVDLLIGTLQVRNGLAERIFAKFDLDLPGIRKLIKLYG